MIRVAAYTGSKREPSGRFRIRQYIGYLKDFDILVHDFASKSGTYPPSNKLARPLWAFANLSEHMITAPLSYGYDLAVFQREFLSSSFTLEGLTKKPRILDVDDSIWLQGNGKFAEKLARNSQAIICGNDFLAAHFEKWNKHIHVIPTGVDITRYGELTSLREFVIVWCGSHSNFKYLYGIEQALFKILKLKKGLRLRIIADIPPTFKAIQCSQLEYVAWSPENEVKYLKDAWLGIMPLEDSVWTRGKCSFKMLTYMAAGLPVVVSSIGMNKDILSMGDFGMGVRSESEWINAISYLLENSVKANEMGENGRGVVEKYYSAKDISGRIANVIEKTL